jgi:hypothetical protein
MSASYLHFVKQYQNRIGLSHKELNKLDRKHNDINLMKKLQQLYPRVSAASSEPATGFYGTLDITNEKTAGSHKIDIYARLYYNGNPLTNEITISHPHTGQLEVLIADRLPSRESILTLRVRFEAGITSVDLDAYDGFEPAGLTTNPLTENNYLSMLVNVGNVDNGILSMTLVTTTPE